MGGLYPTEYAQGLIFAGTGRDPAAPAEPTAAAATDPRAAAATKRKHDQSSPDHDNEVE